MWLAGHQSSRRPQNREVRSAGFKDLSAPVPALKLPGLTINTKERCVDIEATVCLDEGSL